MTPDVSFDDWWPPLPECIDKRVEKSDLAPPYLFPSTPEIVPFELTIDRRPRSRVLARNLSASQLLRSIRWRDDALDERLQTFRNTDTSAGRGAFSTILRFENDAGQAMLVKLGRARSDLDADSFISRAMMRAWPECTSSLVRSQRLTPMLMAVEAWQGDWREFSGQLGDEEMMSVMYTLVRLLRCLGRLGLWYTDLKLRNLLWRCVGGRLQLTAGDLGSVWHPSMRSDAIATYPAPERWANPKPGIFWSALESDVAWGVGIVWLQLWKRHDIVDVDSRYAYDRVENGPSLAAHERMLDQLPTNTWGPIARALLDYRPSQRATLAQTLASMQRYVQF